MWESVRVPEVMVTPETARLLISPCAISSRQRCRPSNSRQFAQSFPLSKATVAVGSPPVVAHCAPRSLKRMMRMSAQEHRRHENRQRRARDDTASHAHVEPLRRSGQGVISSAIRTRSIDCRAVHICDGIRDCLPRYRWPCAHRIPQKEGISFRKRSGAPNTNPYPKGPCARAAGRTARRSVELTSRSIGNAEAPDGNVR